MKKSLSVDLYSMDFTGADRVDVVTTDYTKNDQPESTKTINDSDTIQMVVDILAKLPRNGEIFRSFVPEYKKTFIAYKAEQPFAYFEMYNEKLKTEGTSFYDATDDTIKQFEQNLWSLS